MAASGPSSFVLIQKNQKIKTEKSFNPPCRFLRFCSASHIAKAKPSFTPYALARFSVRPLPAFD